MTSALRKLPDFEGRVFRGSDSLKKAAEYTVGCKVTWSAFSSSSASEKVALLFSGEKGLMFKIDITKGKDISAFSKFSEEQEVLLPPNCKLFVAKSKIFQNGEALSTIHLVERTKSFKW